MVRWYWKRRYQVLLSLILIVFLGYYALLHSDLYVGIDLEKTRRKEQLFVESSSMSSFSTRTDSTKTTHSTNNDPRHGIFVNIERSLVEALKQDKGTGCDFPKLDPFAKETTQFDVVYPNLECPGEDWVECHLSTCKLKKNIVDSIHDIECTYTEIIYVSDSEHYLGYPVILRGNVKFVLSKSDHLNVKCTGVSNKDNKKTSWQGYVAGLRPVDHKPFTGKSPYNILFIGFDSTSKNGFIRRMPKSYKVISEQLKSVVLDGYNIVGDGTPAALMPILIGKNELELPDVRKVAISNLSVSDFPFLFFKLTKRGYRTAYFEDMPNIGTFQYRFDGFKYQPTDHYLRAFYLEQDRETYHGDQIYCVGDKPRFQFMLDLTKQFSTLPGKKFSFTFIADICHNDFNRISVADDYFSMYLTDMLHSGVLEDTALFVMSDHGPRYANVRNTLQGKLEERLPFMSIRLPDKLQNEYPELVERLKINKHVLTTPHDVHNTVLDLLDMMEFANPKKIEGADFPRSMSLLREIPSNRSCSEAGIEAHWCACLRWINVNSTEKIYEKAANGFVNYINKLTEGQRDKCVPRTLKSIEWLMYEMPNNKMLKFEKNADNDGYTGKFNANLKINVTQYQIKITIDPGHGIYEGSMTYYKDKDKFEFSSRDISRINAYNDEPKCISATHPHLNMYCYCENQN